MLLVITIAAPAQKVFSVQYENQTDYSSCGYFALRLWNRSVKE